MTQPSKHMDSARAFFDRVVHTATDWSAPTPCARWTARDLLNHLVSEQLWVPHLLNGETTDDVGNRYDGDVLGDDPIAAWERANTAAAAAWAATSDDMPVHLSSGEAPARDYRWQMTLDLAVHGWDMAKATGADPAVDAAVAEALITEFTEQIEAWRGWIFADAVATDRDASPTDRLVALMGRDPHWRP
ncbi:TIGR03086 family metal-binding protein [Actinokineospora pegani]|uniref:TIGR03086 family metal-binding protein n=1 Tax=Actinokineospora pegani TaxID=2654637 RepID=UPI001F163B41|nr:TIGR03086 family metal-binding protein [Actinokineospora pegani]